MFNLYSIAAINVSTLVKRNIRNAILCPGNQETKQVKNWAMCVSQKNDRTTQNCVNWVETLGHWGTRSDTLLKVHSKLCDSHSWSLGIKNFESLNKLMFTVNDTIQERKNISISIKKGYIFVLFSLLNLTVQKKSMGLQ